MQSLGSVSTAQLLANSQKNLWKLEVYDGANWINICSIDSKNYLKSVSLSLGGPGATADPIAGKWSAELDNYNAIFHPANTGSDYDTLLRIGRPVRISVGGTYGGSDVYWQRLIGYMDEPRFIHSTKTVLISGTDYMQDLIDTDLRSGTSTGNYWGTSATYSTSATVQTLGAEIYAENDALEIGASEGNNVTGWSILSNATFASVAEVGGGSSYVGKLEKGESTGAGSATNNDVGSLTGGTTYICSFKYILGGTATATSLGCAIYKTGTTTLWGSVSNLKATSWTTASFEFTAPESAAARMKFTIIDAAGTAYFYIDQVSIKARTGDGINAYYELPDGSNGPYYVTLDGEPIWFADGLNGWYYDEATNVISFSGEKIVETGTNNLVVYYYTTQTVENVVADILVTAGMYNDRAAALAAMDYTATSTTVDRVWFDAGTSCLTAIQRLCERVNYRFWFGYDGTPHFKPAPTSGSVDFAFSNVHYLQESETFQDVGQVFNRIVIEGMEQGMYSTSEDKRNSRYTGTTSDATSIAAYREKTLTLTNHLFQDDTTITAMVATLLAAYKDPKYYSHVTVAYCPAPIEVGDTITWVLQLAAAYGWPLYGGFVYGTATYGSNGLQATVTGIVRNVSITNGETTYLCEVA